MSAAELARRLQAVIEEWPGGCVVYHKSCGRRGTVVEWSIDAGGCVTVIVDWGSSTSWDKCLTHSLSATKIGDYDGSEAAL